MSDFDKLPIDRQKLLMYEVSGVYNKTKLGEMLGITATTVSKWMKDPLYQSARQEIMNDLKKEIVDEFRGASKIVINGIYAEMIERVNEGALRIVDFDKLVKSLHVLHNDFIKPSSNTPEEEEKDSTKDKKMDLSNKLIERMRSSPTGQKHLSKKKE